MTVWKVVGVVAEGQPIEIGGLDPWTLKWTRNSQPPVFLPHPGYPAQRHSMHVFESHSGDTKVVFAAGELSANVWGFYAPA
jgi:hypothetical protein